MNNFIFRSFEEGDLDSLEKYYVGSRGKLLDRTRVRLMKPEVVE